MEAWTARRGRGAGGLSLRGADPAPRGLAGVQELSLGQAPGGPGPGEGGCRAWARGIKQKWGRGWGGAREGARVEERVQGLGEGPSAVGRVQVPPRGDLPGHHSSLTAWL